MKLEYSQNFHVLFRIVRWSKAAHADLSFDMAPDERTETARTKPRAPSNE